MNNAQPTTKLYDLESTTMGMSVQISVVMPPGYDSSESLPLLIRLHGGGEDRAEPIDLSLNGEEQAYIDWFNGGAMAAGEPPPNPDFHPLGDAERAPTMHRRSWDPPREGAAGDPAMKRAYAQLPRTR